MRSVITRAMLGAVMAGMATMSAAAGQDSVPAEPILTLQEAVSMASGSQPSLVAYEREAVAAEEAAEAAETLPDLRLTLGIQNFPILRGENAFSPTEERMTMYTIGIMREQVRRSRREAEAARIRADALVSRREATVQERQIRRDVMLAWIAAVEARATQRLLNALIADLRTGREAMEAGVSTGRTAPSLALQADAEIAVVRGDLADAKAAEARARAELARWLGPAAFRPLPGEVPTIDVREAVPSDIFRIATHPSLQVAVAQQEVASRQVEVARQERKSDISWSVMLGIRPEYGEVISGQVSIPLQINRSGRQDRKVAEAQARADAARLRAEDVRRELERQYRVAVAQYEGSDAKLAQISGEAIPALQAAFEVAEARYAAGGGTLDEAFEVAQRYVEATIDATKTRAARERAAAQIVYVLGEIKR